MIMFVFFCCLAFAYNPSGPNDKFDMRGVPCVFLGYPPLKKGYKLLNLVNNTEFFSRDVKFHEEIFPFQPGTDSRYLQPVPVTMPMNSAASAPTFDDDLYFSDSIHPDDTAPPIPPAAIEVPAASPNIEPRKSTRAHHPPQWQKDYHINHTAKPIANMVTTSVAPSFHCFLTTLTSVQEPHSFKEAVKHSHWVHSMNEELQALENNQTWVITELPPGKTAIGCKWLFKTKFFPNGSIERYKSRLVILGNHQKFGVDYKETFAPVAKMTTVRTLLAVAAIQEWHTLQMDVSNAFLHGDLSEPVYIKLPPGYTHFGCRIEVNNSCAKTPTPALVCKLLKALYGLRQAPRLWFSKQSLTLLSLGFKQSKSDYSLFLKQTSTSTLAVLVYVDDLLICGSSMSDIHNLKQMLSTQFHMKDLGPISYFLGLEVDRSPSGFFLSQ